MTAYQDQAVLRLTPTGSDIVQRAVAAERPIAIEYNGIGYAVMMATPLDLEAFATGFTLTERIAEHVGEIVDIDCFEAERGWIVRVTVAAGAAERIAARVRHRTSETACGLCGIENLEQVERPVRGIPPAPTAPKAALFNALGKLRRNQPLNRRTGAVHGAAQCNDGGEVLRLFEDVGRHNALDKLVGTMARGGETASGFFVVTSRISFEMVDKALIAGTPMLVGISAPTTMAVSHARRHDLTLAALARADSILVLNDPHRRYGAPDI